MWTISMFTQALSIACAAVETHACRAIPKRIIHTLVGQPVSSIAANEVWNESYKSWRRFFPPGEFRHVLAGDKECQKCVTDEFPELLNRYQEYPSPVQRSDVCRVCLLYTMGGIYADVDYETFVNFYEDLPCGHISLVESPYKASEVVQNSLMASPPHHFFWRSIMKHFLDYSGPLHRVLNATGPRLLSNAIQNEESKDLVNILPCRRYQPAAPHRIGLPRVAPHCGVVGAGDVGGPSGQWAVHWATVTWMNLGHRRAGFDSALLQAWRAFHEELHEKRHVALEHARRALQYPGNR
eukprot:gnl/MRDRNA2_/MRDRNA2_64338_c0_seq2.p1 gnl/MRDRNA2_/MRDRNA2_64338_c0~~gnl/MRDRNA2_/MRDRNA2_64338_c0_seq2.p1  ORF type:complete len:296 (-),score=38.85 gnl/MRDRNA2_/MRDRNA2_64338_c0_seq2:74-961(-)